MALPEKIGRYKIKSELGRSSMAVVYHAYDPRFEREVAIKVLPREMLHDPQFRSRFEREIKFLAGLEHPVIVPVYDVGDEDGQPYFVMRYMTGGSLSAWIAKGTFSLQDTARIIEKIAQGLAYAHSKGIVHRDLKPDNILFDANNEPFISDFGVAKLTEASAGSTVRGMAGTPAYMSPEQAQGTDIDIRSDIYSLGVVVYQMLSGQVPFKADTQREISIKHAVEPIPNILNICSDLPVEIDVFIKTVLAKDRDKRYATSVDLAKALNLIAFGHEGNIALNTTLGGSRRWTASLVAGIILFVALAGFALLRSQFSLAERPTMTPSFSAVPTLITVTVPPPLETATLEVTAPVFAPFCSENLIIPTPFVRETNYSCFKKRPYTALIIPDDATFEVIDPKGQGSCISEATSNGRRVLSCSGPSFLVYDLKVCAPPITENSDLNKCSQGDTFDSSNQCCIAAPPQGAGCNIFVIKLKGC